NPRGRKHGGHPEKRTRPGRLSRPLAFLTMLEVNELNAGYGQSVVIHSATFRAAKSEILAIMGRNGMGKSTLLKSLIGLISSKSGSVKVDGVEVTGMSSHRRV